MANDCPICYEYNSDFLPCGHKVHIACIKKCDKKICPLCRHPVFQEIKEHKHIKYYSYDGVISIKKKKYELAIDDDQKISLEKFA